MRQHILDPWLLLNALEVHKHVATSGSKPNPTRAHRLRDAGKILGLKVGAAFQYPEFQFDTTTGQPRPEMPSYLLC